MNNKTRKLNQQNNILDEQIREENQSIFTDMICYLRSADISEYDIELVRQDLTEMVLSAQERGENISTVIGNNYKEFCDEVIANIPPKTKVQKFISFLDLCCWTFSILLAINIVISSDTILLIKNLITGESASFNISVSIGKVISIILIIFLANFIVNVIVKNVFSEAVKHKKMIEFISGAVLMSILLLIAWVGKKTLFTINIFLACFVTVVLYAGHKFLESL